MSKQNFCKNKFYCFQREKDVLGVIMSGFEGVQQFSDHYQRCQDQRISGQDVERPGLERRRNEGFLWRRRVLDFCFILFVQVCVEGGGQKSTLDDSQAQSTFFFFWIETIIFHGAAQIGQAGWQETCLSPHLQHCTTTASNFFLKKYGFWESNLGKHFTNRPASTALLYYFLKILFCS